MSKKSMFSVFKNRMLPKQLRQQRAKLNVEMMDNRINPALILVNDPAANIINGVQSQNAGEFCILFAASNNNPHRVDVFDDTANTGSGIRVVGTDFGADGVEGTADDTHNDYVITDSDMTTLGQIRGQIWRGIAIDLSYNSPTMVDPAFSAGGHGGGNDIISAAPGDAKYLPPGFFFGDQGLGFTNPTQHRLCQANGGDGNDTICGGNSNDVLTGGNGNDVLAGGNGKDSMFGGAGYDCVLADNADLFGGSSATNVSGGTGGPKLAGNAANEQLPALAANGADLTGAARYSQVDTLIITDGSGASKSSVYTNTDFEVIYGGSGADNIISNNPVLRGVEMYGNDGNDYLESQSAGSATSGRDTIYGGAGNDTLVGGAGNDLIHGDAVQGGQAPTQCDPNPFPNEAPLPCLSATLCGGQTIGSLLPTYSVGSGNDSLVGGTGDDTVEGGLGNDTFVGGAGNDVMCDLGGNDTVNYCDSPAAVTVVLGNVSPLTPSASVFAGGDAQGDSTPVPTSIENVWGSNFDDFIQGNNIANFLDGNGGNDTMFGVDGDDTMEGGAGNDYMYGDNGNDQMYGQEGNDNIEGGNGNDSMFGGAGDDTLEGQRGNDCINGGTGNDTADGGLGTDTFVLDFGNGQNPTSLQNALVNGGPFLNNTLKATAGNDPLNVGGGAAGDQYFGGQGRDNFMVYGAWVEINPGTASARLVADNARVNDVGNFLSNISNAGLSDFNTSGSFNNTDVVQYNTDFTGNPTFATGASDYTQPRFTAGAGSQSLCRYIEGASICGPDPVLPAGQPTPPAP